jgi:hypothetical protein
MSTQKPNPEEEGASQPENQTAAPAPQALTVTSTIGLELDHNGTWLISSFVAGAIKVEFNMDFSSGIRFMQLMKEKAQLYVAGDIPKGKTAGQVQAEQQAASEQAAAILAQSAPNGAGPTPPEVKH